MNLLSEWGYIAAAILFILGLKMLGRADTARRGNMVSAIGMLLAIVVTLLRSGLALQWVFVGIFIGAAVGAVAARRVQMTEMPEMVALLNGAGGLSSLLIGWAEYHMNRGAAGFGAGTATAVYLAVLIGGITVTGSVVAYAKLSGKLNTKPIMFTGQRIANIALLGVIVLLGFIFISDPKSTYPLFVLAVLLALALGVMAVIPIGGADMPVVISLLNSYSGLAGAAAGFVIGNSVLIVAGSLVGASGIILTSIMCKAMNRSLSNVLFSGFGAGATGAGGTDEAQGEVRALNAQDAFYILEAARSVAIIPGYGMAVAQAQHAVKELGSLLEQNGCEVRYAIHPVAGRMPGHMNVLLAEADVPYEQLVEMDSINPIMPTIDVAIVIGANDVVNPAARETPSSPIYGMPVINVDQAKTVFVLKRSMAAGFAGIENPLFFKENTRMIFGDAKHTVQGLVAEFKT